MVLENLNVTDAAVGARKVKPETIHIHKLHKTTKTHARCMKTYDKYSES